MDWKMILFLIGAALAAWLMWWYIKRNPDQFSKENLGKSFSVLAILALILIVFIGFLILLVKG